MTAELRQGEDLKISGARVAGGRLEFFWSDEADEVVLVPEAPVRLVVDGQQVEGLTRVNRKHKVEATAVQTEPLWEMSVSVAPDRLAATMQVNMEAGQRWELEDAAFSPRLRITARLAETIPPRVPELEQVLSDLKARGIVFGLVPEAVQRVINTGGKAVIARGLDFEPGKDAFLTMVFQEEVLGQGQGTVATVFKREITWVEPGQVLVVKTGPEPGKDGIDVYGQPIKAPAPKDVQLKAGAGAKLEQEGTVAVAERAGRPGLLGSVAVVFENYEVDGDLTPAMGHLSYRGDVLIRGSVLENLEVIAEGKVEVTGDAYECLIKAGDAVEIKGNAIGARIQAGGTGAQAARWLTEVSKAAGNLASFQAAWEQLLAAGSARGGIKYRAGILLMQLGQTSFPEFARENQRLAAGLAALTAELGESRLQEYSKLVQKLTPPQVLTIEDSEAISDLLAALQALLEELESLLAGLAMSKADIKVQYAQGSTLIASGNIELTGKGAMNTLCYAGEGVLVKGRPGVFRGGEIKARGLVEINVLGTAAETASRVEVSPAGAIKAKKAHPGVVLVAGARVKKLDYETTNLEFLP